MTGTRTWHTSAIDSISHHFAQDPDARAVILTGSLAADDIQPDMWSDVDVKIVLADHAADRYIEATAWLEPFGRIIGFEKYENLRIQTLRVCLEGFRRFDFVFVAESALREGYRFEQPCKVLWTTLPDLETCIAPQPADPQPHPVTSDDIARMAGAFWFKVSVAIAKIMRNDLLIGAHLALDLARDCLVLQMMRRDREKNTTVHRTGGWGNELVDQLVLDAQHPSARKLLDLIHWNCETFDTLAADLAPGYDPRLPYLQATLDQAMRALCT